MTNGQMDILASCFFVFVDRKDRNFKENII